jgi:hypothetical protein
VKVLERSKFRCERCGLRQMTGLHMSHRQARGMGGARSRKVIAHHRLANLNALCAGCHLRYVEAEPTLAYQDGWKVRRGLEPEDVPVRMWDGVWMLGNDGSRTPWALPSEQ